MLGMAFATSPLFHADAANMMQNYGLRAEVLAHCISQSMGTEINAQYVPQPISQNI